MVKVLNDDNKHLEKKIVEQDKVIKDIKNRNSELSHKFNEKDEIIKKKYEQKQLIQKNLELETEIS